MPLEGIDYEYGIRVWSRHQKRQADNDDDDDDDDDNLFVSEMKRLQEPEMNDDDGHSPSEFTNVSLDGLEEKRNTYAMLTHSDDKDPTEFNQ